MSDMTGLVLHLVQGTFSKHRWTLFTFGAGAICTCRLISLSIFEMQSKLIESLLTLLSYR
jgi:hypothetical protein